jgi:protein-disulfide isomerase
LHADDGIEHKKLPLQQSLPLVQTIEKSALRMGSGPVKVYAFVDPMCPHSRDFVEMIAESEKMRAGYSYYFYLYSLPRMHSEAVVAAIYDNANPMELLLDVMVRHKKVQVKKTAAKSVFQKIKEIAAVAEKLDVYKRPYIIMVKKPKKMRGQ